MTVVLDFVFECILDPNHKVNGLKNMIKKNAIYAKTTYDIVTGKEKYIWECYNNNKRDIGKKVDNVFKGVKFPW